MGKSTISDENQRRNKEKFNNELKMHINRKLFEKNLISEEMYFFAKESLLKRQEML